MKNKDKLPTLTRETLESKLQTSDTVPTGKVSNYNKRSNKENKASKFIRTEKAFQSKSDILKEYHEYLNDHDIKPVFLNTQVPRKINKKLSDLKFNSIYDSITQISTLNTLSSTNSLNDYNSSFARRKTEIFNFNSKDKISQNLSNVLEKEIALERSNMPEALRSKKNFNGYEQIKFNKQLNLSKLEYKYRIPGDNDEEDRKLEDEEIDEFKYDNNKIFQEKQYLKRLIKDISNEHELQLLRDKAERDKDELNVKHDYHYEVNEENFNFSNFKNALQILPFKKDEVSGNNATFFDDFNVNLDYLKKMKNIDDNTNSYLKTLKKKFQADHDLLGTKTPLNPLASKVKTLISNKYKEIAGETKTQMDGLRNHYHYVEYLQYKYEKFNNIAYVTDQKALKAVKSVFPKAKSNLSLVITKIMQKKKKKNPRGNTSIFMNIFTGNDGVDVLMDEETEIKSILKSLKL